MEESECRYFLYENNDSIHRNIKEEISRSLGVSPIMINSALVSAQQRKRCYWTNIPNVTQPADKGVLLRDVLESGVPWQEKSYCMTASYNGAVIRNTLERSQRTMIAEPVTKPIRIGEYGKGGQGQRIYSVNGKSITLSALGGGQGAKTGLYKIDLPDGDYIIRKLTPIEAERLQTLPDNYTAGISSTQRYKCIGNGWTVDVIAHILGGLK
ncbi:MAG: DNA cytosine methyltransferase [Ruminococcus sp.]